MTVDEIANVLSTYAYANRSNPQFFRDIETELVERELHIVPVHLVDKILQAYSYSNLASSLMYYKIARTIKIVQHEIPIIKIAKYAYLFSKASENMNVKKIIIIIHVNFALTNEKESVDNFFIL